MPIYLFCQFKITMKLFLEDAKCLRRLLHFMLFGIVVSRLNYIDLLWFILSFFKNIVDSPQLVFVVLSVSKRSEEWTYDCLKVDGLSAPLACDVILTLIVWSSRWACTSSLPWRGDWYVVASCSPAPSTPLGASWVVIAPSRSARLSSTTAAATPPLWLRVHLGQSSLAYCTPHVRKGTQYLDLITCGKHLT